MTADLNILFDKLLFQAFDVKRGMIVLSCHFVYIRGRRSCSRSSFPCHHMFAGPHEEQEEEEEENEISSQMQWGSESARQIIFFLPVANVRIKKWSQHQILFIIHGFSLEESGLLFISVSFVGRGCDVIARVFRMQRFSEGRLFGGRRTGNLSRMVEAAEVWSSNVFYLYKFFIVTFVLIFIFFFKIQYQFWMQ